MKNIVILEGTVIDLFCGMSDDTVFCEIQHKNDKFKIMIPPSFSWGYMQDGRKLRKGSRIFISGVLQLHSGCGIVIFVEQIIIKPELVEKGER